MSFRELTMIDVKEVLRRWQAGQSARQMSREGVVGRRTATRYIDAAKEAGVEPDSELTDEVIRAVANAYSGRTWALIPTALGRSFRAHLGTRSGHLGTDSGALGRLFRRTWAPRARPGLHLVRVPDRAA
jgi:hypothetical protein